MPWICGLRLCKFVQGANAQKIVVYQCFALLRFVCSCKSVGVDLLIYELLRCCQTSCQIELSLPTPADYLVNICILVIFKHMQAKTLHTVISNHWFVTPTDGSFPFHGLRSKALTWFQLKAFKNIDSWWEEMKHPEMGTCNVQNAFKDGFHDS